MGFRFRLGPFTFGSTGTHLSLWRSKAGLSIPLSRKGRSFGKIGFGPFRWFFSGSHGAPHAARGCEAEVANEQHMLGSYEAEVIKTFRSDRQFLEKLRRYGVPWRGVQERLKEELPDRLSDRDQVAYGLVPKAMEAVFGQQEVAWKTERRPSKSGSGYTTWIVIHEPGA